MKELYLGVGTPSQAPVDILYAIAKVSDEEEPLTPMCMSGWQNGSITDLETWNPIREVPHGFAAVWLSLTEKRIYEIDVDFSDDMVENLTKIINKGFKNRRGKKVSYTHFKASFFPGGEVRFHLLSSSRIQSLDSVFNGTATTEYNQAFLEQFGDNSNIRTIDAYCNVYYQTENETDRNLRKMSDFVNDIALPNNIWKKYYRRYNYDIRFEFENPYSYLYSWCPKFTNAESYFCQSEVNEDVVIKQTSTICLLNLWWRSNWDQYTSFFYFDEDEIMTLFEKAFESHPDERGELVIKVCKYDNKFIIEMRIGDDVYPLRKTEMRSFYNFLFELSEDGHLKNKNYEGNHKNKFNCL